MLVQLFPPMTPRLGGTRHPFCIALVAGPGVPGARAPTAVDSAP